MNCNESDDFKVEFTGNKKKHPDDPLKEFWEAFHWFTTKPLTNTTFVKTTQLTFGAEKSSNFLELFLLFCGLDGIRTRDPMRDRHVF